MERLVNFRDLGGILGAEGRQIKRNRLLRSGEVVNIGEKDKLELLEQFQLKTIVDFRADNECLRSPDDRIAGVQYCHIDIMKDIKESVTNPFDISGDLDVKIAEEGMQDVYRQIILNSTARSGYRQFVRTLAESKTGAVLFHCYAGKDRTGIGAAIILRILGVSQEDILADYLKTNRQRERANQDIQERGRIHGMTEKHLAGLQQLMIVKESYLKQIYEVIETHYKTFDCYIKEGLSISDREISQLRENYLDE